MSTVSRTKKHVVISSANTRFRELIMTRLAKDSPFNIKVNANNDIVLRRATTVDFEELIKVLIEDSTKAQEPLTVTDWVQDKETVVSPYKYWYWWGQKMASMETHDLEEEVEEVA